MPDSEAPRAYTAEEMREIFLQHIRTMVEYWATTDLGRPEFRTELAKKGEVVYRMEGLVHSILVMFDGCAASLPAFDITPSPHPDDEKWLRDQGVNWWAPVVINECQLHEVWYRR